MKLTTPNEMTYPPINIDAICELIEAELAKDRLLTNTLHNIYEKRITIRGRYSADEKWAVYKAYQEAGWTDLTFYNENTSTTVVLLTINKS